MTKRKAMIVDTSVLIHDPESIYVLMNDINHVYIHSSVLMQLDYLKNKRDIGKDCRDSIKIIKKIQESKSTQLKIVSSSDFSHPELSHLDPSSTDHRLIALAHNLLQKNKDNDKYNEIKIITNDDLFTILATDLNITTEQYINSNVNIDERYKIKKINVPWHIINEDMSFECNVECIQNEGVVCLSDWDANTDTACNNSEWKENFCAIYKDGKFHIIPNDISCMGLVPYSMNSGTNWEQYIGMAQLLDPDIQLCFLLGGSGSGKTLLALACAIQQRKMYRNILVSRPMIALNDEDKMGALPGDINDKLKPWIKPITKSLTFIGSVNQENKNIIQKIRDTGKLEVEPLDYIRGITYFKDILIVDEAQNLTPHQIKTIITRCGEKSKIIFTGDLGQIDRKGLNKKSSGLAYASYRMKDNKLVSVSNFRNTVRSELVKLAEETL